MKILRFFFWTALSILSVVYLNKRTGDIPPAGKFLDPFHGFWQNAETPDPNINSLLNLPQLNDTVKVEYEKNLIPHIFAGNEYDLYFSQGFITAAFRLWQMEFQMLFAAGRTSELVGEAAIELDRMQRRIGLVYGAENSLYEMKKNQVLFNHIQAYSDGVNAYIEQLDYKSLPIEYKLLDYSPEEWTPLKNVLLLKYMAQDLSGTDHDLENTNIVSLFGKERYDLLFPDFPENVDPVIPVEEEFDFTPVEVIAPDTFDIYKVFIPTIFPNVENGFGSNNWALSGQKTKSGNTILANDPHLSLRLPSIWFIQQLNAPGVNTYGATIPGMAGVLIGFNDSISWGLTNAPRDVRDWYQISFKDEHRAEYLYNGKWLKMQQRFEEIKVRNGESFFDTVLYTHYGPIVYEDKFNQDHGKSGFALRWTAHEPSRELYTIYHLNRSSSLIDIQDAIDPFICPPQNIVVATRSGDIGMFIEGLFPLKWNEQGKFLMDGSDPKYEWQGFIPKEHNAQSINPERGFVSSANQHSFSSNYPYYYYNFKNEHFRNRRINNIFRQDKDFTVEDMKKLQNDNFNLMASEILPFMLDSLNLNEGNEDFKKIADELRNWDYYNEIEYKAPSYFEVWWHELYELLWDEFNLEGQELAKPEFYTSIQFILNNPNDPFMDIQGTAEDETLHDLIRISFEKAVDSVQTWVDVHETDPLWYQFKDTKLEHLARIDAFSKDKLLIGGNKRIVNAASKDWGPSWRMIVELGDTIEAWGIYPGGQSGNPGSHYYNTFVDDWAAGNYFKIKFLREFSGESGINQTLIPSE
ncbi:penicillin acylase family protein [Bacteroidota bacterium]